MHGLGLSHDVVAVLLHRQRGLGGRCRAKFGGGLERRIDDHLHRERQGLLAQEVKSPELHRFDDSLGGAVGAHDDDHGIGGLGPDPGQEIKSSGRSEMHLGDDEIRFLKTENLEGVGGVGLRDNPHSRGLELESGPVEKIGLAINNKDGLVDD